MTTSGLSANREFWRTDIKTASFTGSSRFCLHPRYRSVVRTEACPRRKLSLFQFASVDVTQLCACPSQIVGRKVIYLHAVGTVSEPHTRPRFQRSLCPTMFRAG
jgi:hypothetical protein